MQKDENQITNLALLVARPTGVRVHSTPHQQTKKFTALIEMETPAHAYELLKEIRRQEKKEFTAFWAKDPDFAKMEMVSFKLYSTGKIHAFSSEQLLIFITIKIQKI